MKPVKRRRLEADAWRELLAKFADSELGLRAFCAQEGISPSTFSWWRSRFSGGHRGDEQPAIKRSPVVPASEFVDLGTLGAPAAARAERVELRLELGGGLVLHLVRG